MGLHHNASLKGSEMSDANANASFEFGPGPKQEVLIIVVCAASLRSFKLCALYALQFCICMHLLSYNLDARKGYWFSDLHLWRNKVGP
jgi:hypothetical protein